MRAYLNRLARFLTVFLLFVVSTVFSQQTADEPRPQTQPKTQESYLRNVRTILLLTSYPVADVVTSSFFDAFRKGIRELNLPIDCHVVELNAAQKGNEDKVDATFERLSTSINNGLYSMIVTVNHEAADVVMRNYDKITRDVPVLFTGLGRVPNDLKRLYPNSTAIGIPDDTIGTVEMGLKLFPEVQNLLLVVDETTISEETRNDILSRCKIHFPQLDYRWINSLMSKSEIQITLNGFSSETMVLFFPSHDYANGHNETLNAFVQNIGFDERFPCLALDDTLIGSGVVGGSMIETHRLGYEAARAADPGEGDRAPEDRGLFQVQKLRVLFRQDPAGLQSGQQAGNDVDAPLADVRDRHCRVPSFRHPPDLLLHLDPPPSPDEPQHAVFAAGPRAGAEPRGDHPLRVLAEERPAGKGPEEA